MPSPKFNRIIVSVLEDNVWLQPVDSLELPRHIQVGECVQVPGEIKALIRSETHQRKPGQRLYIPRYQVRLVAVFDERLNRSLPEFHPITSEGKSIDIRYPIELYPPNELECVPKGEVIRFDWTVSGRF